MLLEQIGSEIRRFRQALGLTQAQLASAAHVTRTTLNQLENGTITDLGARKVHAILGQLGLALNVQPLPTPAPRNYLRMAATTASVSFKAPLTERELLRALLTGRVPANRRPHLRTLLEEARPQIVNGLIEQLSQWTPRAKIQKSLARIAAAVGLPDKKW